MKAAYISCPYGVSEERLLGALLDAGVDPDAASAGLSLADGRSFVISVQGTGGGISASVDLPGPVTFESLAAFRSFYEALPVRPRIRQGLVAAVDRLASAGFLVGPTGPDRSEAVVDPAELFAVAAIGIGLEMLEIESIYASPLGVSATVDGIAVRPAVARVAAGVPVARRKDASSTPACAALLAGLVDLFGPLPNMRLASAGLGVSRDSACPVQVLVGTVEASPESQVVTILETNIDDMAPQALDYVMSLLFEQGALDVFFTPIQMKKNRPAVLLSVICMDATAESCCDVLMRETTTLGVRWTRADRRCLARETITASTPYGAIRVKAALLGDQVRSVTPEYDDCREAAARSRSPLRRIQDAAVADAWERLKARGWKAVGDPV